MIVKAYAVTIEMTSISAVFICIYFVFKEHMWVLKDQIIM